MSDQQDLPPCSRLFVSVGTTITKEAIYEAFGVFGDIEDCNVPIDKIKGMPRGFAFVKFKKTSEAAAALEAMQGTQLQGEGNKMNVAVSGARREEGSKDSDIVPTRLIITMRQHTDLEEIRGIFGEYGKLVDLTHTKTDDRKAILKYSTFREAAYCYENCDSKYRANFLLPKKKPQEAGQGGRVGVGYGGGMMMQHQSNSGGGGGGLLLPNYPSNNSNKVMVCFNPSLSKDYLSALFNVVPGFVDTMFYKITPDGYAMGAATYDNPKSAAHAVDRLNGFEYPIGSKLQVYFGPDDSQVSSLLSTIKEATSALKDSGINISVNGLPDDDYRNYGYGGGRMDGIGGGGGRMEHISGRMDNMGGRNDGMGGRLDGRIGGVVAHRGSAVQAFGGPEGVSAETQRVCSVNLPPPKPVLPLETEVAQRLFFVICDTDEYAYPEMVTDLFCRFGDLINAHCLKGKRCGYARFASLTSAEHCIRTIDGAKFFSGSLKVKKADAEKYTREMKKRKFD